MIPRITVVVLNWNGREFVGRALEALRCQTFRDFKVVVVDNGSTDGSVGYIRQTFPEVDLVALPSNLGFCAANNIALKRVRGEYAALLNNDAVPAPQWLSELSNALDSHPEAGFAASKIVCLDDPKTIDRAGDSYTVAGAGVLKGRGMPSEDFDEPKPVFGACAAAALYRMDMLRDVGLFDESFFLIYEDVDLSFRAQLAGYKCIYEPKAEVSHMVSRSIERDSETSVYFGHRNLEWVYVKNMPASLVPATIGLHLLYNAASFAYFSMKGKARAFVRAKIDAISGLSQALEKRERIQKSKRVGDWHIFRLFEKELFLPRWTARRKRSKNK